MKTYAKIVPLLIALCVALGASGCSTVSTSSHTFVGVSPQLASSAAGVAILQDKPERSFVRLGEVRAVPSTETLANGTIEEALKREAAKLGADAVIILQDGLEVTGASSTGVRWNRSYDRTMDRVIVGVAIKYNS